MSAVFCASRSATLVFFKDLFFALTIPALCSDLMGVGSIFNSFLVVFTNVFFQSMVSIFLLVSSVFSFMSPDFVSSEVSVFF